MKENNNNEKSGDSGKLHTLTAQPPDVPTASARYISNRLVVYMDSETIAVQCETII